MNCHGPWGYFFGGGSAQELTASFGGHWIYQVRAIEDRLWEQPESAPQSSTAVNGYRAFKGGINCQFTGLEHAFQAVLGIKSFTAENPWHLAIRLLSPSPGCAYPLISLKFDFGDLPPGFIDPVLGKC